MLCAATYKAFRSNATRRIQVIRTALRSALTDTWTGQENYRSDTGVTNSASQEI